MPNYGDVTLNLPPDWSRRSMATDPGFTLTTVGHEGGKADVRLKDMPDQQHQFRWVHPQDVDAISVLRTNHFEFVNKNAGWEKSDNLWEFDGEGRIIHKGQLLMARNRIYYDEEVREREERERGTQKKSAAEEAVDEALRRIEARGATIEDERGQRLRHANSVEPQAKRR